MLVNFLALVNRNIATQVSHNHKAEQRKLVYRGKDQNEEDMREAKMRDIRYWKARESNFGH